MNAPHLLEGGLISSSRVCVCRRFSHIRRRRVDQRRRRRSGDDPGDDRRRTKGAWPWGDNGFTSGDILWERDSRRRRNANKEAPVEQHLNPDTVCEYSGKNNIVFDHVQVSNRWLSYVCMYVCIQ